MRPQIELLETHANLRTRGLDAISTQAHTCAIGQLFDGKGTRQGRRDGRAYTSVLRMAPDVVFGEQGFRVRLVGHIAAAPGGSPVVFRQPGGAEQRPICIVLTTLDEVSIENAAAGKTLATWDVAGTRRIEERGLQPVVEADGAK